MIQKFVARTLSGGRKTQGACRNDAVDERLTALIVEQARLVVVGIGRQERVARRQIHEGLVAVQLLVAEEAEGHVAGAITLDGCRGPEPEGLPIGLDTLTFG